MNKILFTLILVLAISFTNMGQGTTRIEYGSLNELSGKSKVFVYAANLDTRQRIITALNKKKGEKFTVVGKPEEAEFFILYGSQVFDSGEVSMATVIGGIGIGSSSRTFSEAGEYYVVIPGDRMPDGGIRPRVLWGKSGLRGEGNGVSFLAKPKSAVVETTKKFLKELEAARK